MPGGTEANAKGGARREPRGRSETRGLEADPGAAGSRVMVVLFAFAVSVLASAAIPLSRPPASDSHSLSANDLHPSGTLGYSTYLGGSRYDFDWGATTGAFGSAYVVGTTTSTDFPTTPGAFDRILDGTDGFVAKLSPDGSRLDWATFLGGSSTDWANAVAVDASGNVYVAGLTYSADFPVTPGAFDTTINGAVDVFVAELSADGSRVLWATFLGSTENENARAIAIDISGNVVVTGWTASPAFPVTPGAFDRTCGTDGSCNPSGMQTQNDGFVTAIRPGGASLAWSTFLGGEGQDEPVSLAVDAAGFPIVAGQTRSAGFPTTAGAFQPTKRALTDAFVTELTADGTALAWSTYFGGNGDEGATAAIDSAGAIVVSGVTNSTDLPTSSGVLQPSIAGQRDGFVGKLSSNASGVTWLTYLGGSGDEDGATAVIGSTGTIFVGGSTDSADFPVSSDAFDPSYNGAALTGSWPS